MRAHRWLAIAVLWLGGLVAAPAYAGVELQTETTVQGSSPSGGAVAGKALAGRLLIDGDRVRIEGIPGGASRHAGAMVFRPDRQVLWVLDESDRQYVEMSPATAQAMRSTMDAARARMKEELGKMKPEQRAMVERAMKAQGLPLDAAAPAGATAAEPIAVKPTGKSDSVAGVACREFEVVRGKAKVAETCVAAWATVGVAKGDLDGLRKLALFQNEIFTKVGFQGVAGPAPNDSFAMMDQLDGLPIRIRTFRDGALASETRVVKVGRREVDASLFELPAGYKPRALLPGAPAT